MIVCTSPHAHGSDTPRARSGPPASSTTAGELAGAAYLLRGTRLIQCADTCLIVRFQYDEMIFDCSTYYLLIISFQWCVRQSTETENLMTAIERIYSFTKLTSEAPLGN